MSQEETVAAAPQGSERYASWLDLALYLIIGFGLFLLAGYAFRGVLAQNTLLSTALILGSNFVIFSGTVLVVGVLRSRLSLAEVGFWPPRLPWTWIAVGLAASLLVLPVRVGLGLLIEYLFTGGVQGLTSGPRMEMLTPHGSLLANFLVSFILGGILVPISEELFFRGALYNWFRQRFSLWPSILASTVLFALGHADTAAVVGTSFVIGLLNAYLFERSRSIWVPITVHLVNNSLAFGLLYLALALQQLLAR
ncbi:MAG TPA: type II CAAX endopeptidase family protein [Anaerolineaceae bacterium]|nr:type II CAAX endopeptidase family protein [Anaerolineaceae bacterium]